MISRAKFLRYAPILVLVVALIIGWLLLSLTPEPKRKAALASSPLVIASSVHSEDASVVIRALGIVKPVQEVAIRPRVVGTVMELNINLEPGGHVAKDSILLQLDPVDYTLEVRRKESSVAMAKADLALEMGQQTVAKAELEQLQRNIPGLETFIKTEDSMNLATRAPHLAQAKANLASAQADLDAALINLARTKVQAPFNALVTERSVSVGSQASTSDVLATLVNTDTYWVEVAIPLDRLQAIREKAQGEVSVKIFLSSGDVREGTVGQITGTLDSASRMGQVLVAVKDPLALQKDIGSLDPMVPMVLGDHVQVEIALGKRNNVIAVPRAALKGNDTVWVAKDGKLDIREIDILWRDADIVYVQQGLVDGDIVITSSLSAPIQDMNVRLSQPKVTTSTAKMTTPAAKKTAPTAKATTPTTKKQAKEKKARLTDSTSQKSSNVSGNVSPALTIKPLQRLVSNTREEGLS